MIVCLFFFVFFKQKTAYEMRISDWSSDVCSSDLEELAQEAFARVLALDDMSCIENLEGYLFCVVTNLVMERARRRHVRDRHEQDAYLEQVMPEPEPELAPTAQQALRILSLSIAGMPDRPRLAFQRFVFADRTAGPVATEMGVRVKMTEIGRASGRER